MTSREQARQALYARLSEVLGNENAVTLMEYLPAIGGAELATRADIHDLRADLRERMDRLDGRMDRLDERMDRLEGRTDGVDGRLHELHGALREQSNTFHAELRTQTRAFVLGLVGATSVVIAAVLGTGLN
jgi:chromosome segregation ATPase